MRRILSVFFLCLFSTFSIADDTDDWEGLKGTLKKQRPWSPGKEQTEYDTNVILIAKRICENPDLVWNGWYADVSGSLTAIKGKGAQKAAEFWEMVEVLNANKLADKDPNRLALEMKYPKASAKLNTLQVKCKGTIQKKQEVVEAEKKRLADERTREEEERQKLAREAQLRKEEKQRQKAEEKARRKEEERLKKLNAGDPKTLYEAALEGGHDIGNLMDAEKFSYLAQAADAGYAPAQSYLGAHHLQLQLLSAEQGTYHMQSAFHFLKLAAPHCPIAAGNLLYILHYEWGPFFISDADERRAEERRVLKLIPKKASNYNFLNGYYAWLDGNLRSANKFFKKTNGVYEDVAQQVLKIFTTIEETYIPKKRKISTTALESFLTDKDIHEAYKPAIQRALFGAYFDDVYDLATELQQAPGTTHVPTAEKFVLAIKKLEKQMELLKEIGAGPDIQEKFDAAQRRLGQTEDAIWRYAANVLTAEHIQEVLAWEESEELLKMIGLLAVAHMHNNEPTVMLAAADRYVNNAVDWRDFDPARVRSFSQKAQRWFKAAYEAPKATDRDRVIAGIGMMEIILSQDQPNLKEALTLYETIIALDADVEFPPKTLEFLGDFLIEMKAFDTGVELLEQALQHSSLQSKRKEESKSKFQKEDHRASLMLKLAACHADAIRKKRMQLRVAPGDDKESLMAEIQSLIEKQSSWSSQAQKLYTSIVGNRDYKRLKMDKEQISALLGASYADQHAIDPDAGYDKKAFDCIKDLSEERIKNSYSALKTMADWYEKQGDVVKVKRYNSLLLQSPSTPQEIRAQAARKIAVFYRDRKPSTKKGGPQPNDAAQELLEYSIITFPTGAAYYDMALLFDDKPEEAIALFVTAAYEATLNDEDGIENTLERARAALQKIAYDTNVCELNRSTAKFADAYLNFLQNPDVDNLFHDLNNDDLSVLGKTALPAPIEASNFLEKFNSYKIAKSIGPSKTTVVPEKTKHLPYLSGKTLEIPSVVPATASLQIAEQCVDRLRMVQALKWYKRAAHQTPKKRQHEIFVQAALKMQQALARVSDDFDDCSRAVVKQNAVAFYQQAATTFIKELEKSTGGARQNLLKGLITIYTTGIMTVDNSQTEYAQKAFEHAQEIEKKSPAFVFQNPLLMHALSTGYRVSDPQRAKMYAEAVLKNDTALKAHQAMSAFLVASLYNDGKIPPKEGESAKRKYAEWLQKSLDVMTSCDGLHRLATCYETGQGVQKDLAKALALHTQSILTIEAVNNGKKERQDHRAYVKKLPDSGLLSEDEKALCRLCNLYLDTVENIGTDVSAKLVNFTDEQLITFVDEVLSKKVSPLAQPALEKIISAIRDRVKIDRKTN